MKLYNTLSRKIENFKPIKDKKIGMYTCGPTVYYYAHLGNLRTYIFEDILKRVLEYNNYKVKHIMNITDVGHLTSDADTGEDKIEKQAKKQKKNAYQIAEFYTKAFKKDLERLNIKKPTVWVKATRTIKEQIKLIQLLEKKGFTYRISDGIYFDTSRLKTYGRLWPKKMKLKEGARVEKVKGKKNPTDFALWKFSPKGVKRQMEWNSPWGKGFPGWHTECVVMSIKYLGIPFDIHCGGVDHILIHHTNEIAQAEAAYGKILANYWLHGEFLILKKKKRMGKSEGNVVILDDLIKNGINPLAYRYLCLTSHYRSPLLFSSKALSASQNALKKLYEKILKLKHQTSNIKHQTFVKYQKKFLKLINTDLNIPKALALMWKVIEDKKISDSEKYALVLDFDKIFGLKLNKVKKPKIPLEIKKMVLLREKYRKQKQWEKADKLRKKIEEKGYKVEDTQKGPEIFPQSISV